MNDTTIDHLEAKEQEVNARQLAAEETEEGIVIVPADMLERVKQQAKERNAPILIGWFWGSNRDSVPNVLKDIASMRQLRDMLRDAWRVLPDGTVKQVA